VTWNRVSQWLPCTSYPDIRCDNVNSFFFPRDEDGFKARLSRVQWSRRQKEFV